MATRLKGGMFIEMSIFKTRLRGDVSSLKIPSVNKVVVSMATAERAAEPSTFTIDTVEDVQKFATFLKQTALLLDDKTSI